MEKKQKKQWQQPKVISTLSIKQTLGANMMGVDARGMQS